MKGRTRRHERGAECGGRGRADRRTARSADGKVVWSWRAHAGAKFSRGSKGFAKATVANAGSPGRVRISRKTTAQGRPVVTACTCGFRARANFLCAGAPGAAATRPSLCPLHFSRAMDQAKLGRISPREYGCMSPFVIASQRVQLIGRPDDRLREAIHSHANDSGLRRRGACHRAALRADPLAPRNDRQRCLKFESERRHAVVLTNAWRTPGPTPRNLSVALSG
jgi:hypothetical protein